MHNELKLFQALSKTTRTSNPELNFVSNQQNVVSEQNKVLKEHYNV